MHISSISAFFNEMSYVHASFQSEAFRHVVTFISQGLVVTLGLARFFLDYVDGQCVVYLFVDCSC